jgi:hypothetical protein
VLVTDNLTVNLLNLQNYLNTFIFAVSSDLQLNLFSWFVLSLCSIPSDVKVQQIFSPFILIQISVSPGRSTCTVHNSVLQCLRNDDILTNMNIIITYITRHSVFSA